MFLIDSSQLRLRYCKKKRHKVLPHERDLASDHHISCSASIEESDGEPILFTAIAQSFKKVVNVEQFAPYEPFQHQLQTIIREATILKGRIFKNKFPKCCPLASHEGFVKFCCTDSAYLTTLEINKAKFPTKTAGLQMQDAILKCPGEPAIVPAGGVVFFNCNVPHCTKASFAVFLLHRIHCCCFFCNLPHCTKASDEEEVPSLC